jgi:hypothetical protein
VPSRVPQSGISDLAEGTLRGSPAQMFICLLFICGGALSRVIAYDPIPSKSNIASSRLYCAAPVYFLRMPGSRRCSVFPVGLRIQVSDKLPWRPPSYIRPILHLGVRSGVSRSSEWRGSAPRGSFSNVGIIRVRRACPLVRIGALP